VSLSKTLLKPLWKCRLGTFPPLEEDTPSTRRLKQVVLP